MLAEYKPMMKCSLEAEGIVSDEAYVLIVRQVAAVAGVDQDTVESINTIDGVLDVLYAICRVANSNPVMLAAAMKEVGVAA
jgi:hypothetical protein